MSIRHLLHAGSACVLLAWPAWATATSPIGNASAALELPVADGSGAAASDTGIAEGAMPAPPSSGRRTGADIYQRFRDGLADKNCSAAETSRWRRHFAHAPGHLSDSQRDVLPLFGYVVDELLDAGLPTEFALIPFVESGYRPDARSPSGPLGMWQFIGITARNQGIPMRGGYDGRLSPVDSTRAAVRYLRTLYGLFGGNWELAVMGYNAGENRILGAIRRSGQRVVNADPAKLGGIPDITRAYVRKLHALACVLDEADDRPQWRTAMQREVPTYTGIELPQGTRSLDDWANRHGYNAQRIRRLNPALAGGNIAALRSTRILAPSSAAALASTAATDGIASAGVRTHTVEPGDTAGAIARRHGVPIAELLRRNGLHPASVLRPGQVLRLDAD
ncbi:MAG: transglycosylase SLT domain-containing protein [Pseudoxanthomonas suwonensis]|nr:transglycosylase SLT domain-containing protein [Pseudoxanthomonas suwonensis]